MDEVEPTVHASLYMPASLHRALKVWLAGQGRSLSEWARDHATADVAPTITNQPRKRPAKK